jgi:hypothetical protein
MFVLRIVAVLAVAAIGANILLWIATRQRRYLDWAWRIGKASIFFALAVLLLFAAERLIVLA